MRNGATAIQRLQIRSSDTDRLRVRLRTSQRLAGMDFRPTGLAPSAILLVRRMVDPLPCTLSLSHQRPLDQEWQRALQRQLDEVYRQSVRPAAGYTSAAPAVLFADEAELLACLALDLARGAATSRWWWQLILRQLDGAGRVTVAQLCGQHPTQIPAIFALLHRWDMAPTVLARLSPTETTVLLSVLLATYQLPDFRVAVPAHDQPGSNAANLGQDAQRTQPAPTAIQGASAPEPATAPWQPWLTSRPVQALAREQLALLGVALTLYQRPAVAQSKGFVQAAARWWVSTATQPPQEKQGAAPQPQGRAGSGTAMASIGHEVKQRAPKVTPVDAAAALQTVQTEGEPRQHRSTHRAQITNGAEVAPYTLEQVDAPDEHAPIDAPHTSAALTADAPMAVTVPPIDETFQVRWPNATALTTELGGLLYLVNVMEQLALPACFEPDWHLASLVGPWGILEALGRGLLATTGERYLADPIWTGLAALAGRAPTVPLGAELVAAGPNRLPDHLPVESNFDRPEHAQLTGALVEPLKPHLHRWLVLFLPWLRAWVRQQFDLADGAAEINFLRTLCCVRGRLFITTSHVDLVLRLDQINLAARLHGLDQDPGWLPHWGRVIKFHFEE